MHQTAYHFASGNSLFSGGLLILIAWVVAVRWRHSRWTSLISFLGVVAVLASATPFPVMVYVVWIMLVLAAFAMLPRTVRDQQSPARDVPIDETSAVDTSGIAAAASGTGRTALRRTTMITGVLMILTTLGMCGNELRSRANLPTDQRFDRMYVIGDSISAGAGNDERAWPSFLAEATGADIINLAQPGHHAGDALKQCDGIDEEAESLILIEIGGNDLLSGRSAKQYESDLRRLIERLQSPRRQLIMLELPLPPGCNSFGTVQRNLAGEFGIALIHRREFASIIAPPENTFDGLHFSELGHRRMAAMIDRYVSAHLHRR